MKLILENFFFCLLLLLSILEITSQSPDHVFNEDEVDAILNSDQKVKLDKFKKLMMPFLTRDFMKDDDIYLLKFLKVNNFEIPAAQRQLKETLEWRKSNNIDNILEEDWSAFDIDYKFGIEGCDYEGRPTAVGYIGDWNFQKAALSGNSKRLMRYADKIYEEANFILRNMQANGSNATRANLILEIDNFSIQQHLCLQCAPILTYVIYTLHRHFPLTINFLIVVNTPEIALPIWQFARPLMPKKSQEFVFLYGKNRNEWQKALLDKHRIDSKQLSRDMGGSGPEALDFNQIRKNGYNFKCPK